ncbi:hypothetical protein C8Q79DRAFT_1115399 [Trametes meyenii]|nr:hypothetical protein C8Q79DRAFT_1115399 [Trametes meyenii]
MYGFKRIHAHEIAQNIWDVAAASERLMDDLDLEKVYLSVTLTVLITFMTYYAITLSFELYRTMAALPIFNIRVYKTVFSWLYHSLTLPWASPKTSMPASIKVEGPIAVVASPTPSEDAQTSEYGASGDSDHDAPTDGSLSPEMSPQLSGRAMLGKANPLEEHFEQNVLVEDSQDVPCLSAQDTQGIIDDFTHPADTLSPPATLTPATVDVDIFQSPEMDGLRDCVFDTEILSQADSLEASPDGSHSPLLLPVHPSVPDLDTPGDFLQNSAVSDACLSTLVQCEDLSAPSDVVRPEGSVSVPEEPVSQVPQGGISGSEVAAEINYDVDISVPAELSQANDAPSVPPVSTPVMPNDTLFDVVPGALEGGEIASGPIFESEYVRPNTPHADVTAEGPGSSNTSLPRDEAPESIVGDTRLEISEATACDALAVTEENDVRPEALELTESMAALIASVADPTKCYFDDRAILPDALSGDTPEDVDVANTGFFMESPLLVQPSIATYTKDFDEEAELEEERDQLPADIEWTPVTLDESGRSHSPCVATDRTDEDHVKTQEAGMVDIETAEASMTLLTQSECIAHDVEDSTLTDHAPAYTIQDTLYPAAPPTSSPVLHELQVDSPSKMHDILESTVPVDPEPIPLITVETIPAEPATLSMQSLMDAALAASPSVKTRLNIGALPNKPAQERKHTPEKPDWAVAPGAPKPSSDVPKHSPMPWRLRRKRRKARASGEGEQVRADGHGGKAVDEKKAGGSEPRRNRPCSSRGEGQKGPRNTTSAERRSQGTSVPAKGQDGDKVSGSSVGRRPTPSIQA